MEKEVHGLLDQAATARWFSVTPETIRRWEREGLIESVHLGRLRRYRLADLEALAAKGFTRVEEKEGNQAVVVGEE